MSKRMPPQHRRQMMKKNRKQLSVRSVLASYVDEPRKNLNFPPDIAFMISSDKTVETYPSLKAAAQAAGVSKNALSQAIFYQNKCKGRYWEYVTSSQDDDLSSPINIECLDSESVN